ncbi:hypothetical protein [Spirilliplanes yamanashiensis]|uniref:Uncharacterized protein n=1 Tax=Spirilliplanes yamanashiensis TaxID=42233 RepID=A0A8J3Y9L3_9ACTN|nr:hypothetical protein [Spirilliplanes yamanashiensis]MDP9815785.1 hypothetical protein [Spirilliplanes yamanashiensis]GIJ04039.1 hypothetical protein Sya03_33910 [Spirilliplanes yamanashiensis]
MDESGQSGDAGRADGAEPLDRALSRSDRARGFGEHSRGVPGAAPAYPPFPERAAAAAADRPLNGWGPPAPPPAPDRPVNGWAAPEQPGGGWAAPEQAVNGWGGADGPWSNAGTALDPVSGVPAWRRPPVEQPPAPTPAPADAAADWPDDARSRYADLLAHLAPEPRLEPVVSASAPPYPYEGDLDWGAADRQVSGPAQPGTWDPDPSAGYASPAAYGDRSVSGSVPRPAGEPDQETVPEVLPQRVPAKPDVPIVPEPPAVEPSAETPELARIATHLRREDLVAPQERPDGFDVNAILAAVREVDGVRDAALRTTPEGAHSLRLDLADGADPAEVSRIVARLLQERMGLAAAMQGEPTPSAEGFGSGAFVPSQPTGSGRTPLGSRAPDRYPTGEHASRSGEVVTPPVSAPPVVSAPPAPTAAGSAQVPPGARAEPPPVSGPPSTYGPPYGERPSWGTGESYDRPVYGERPSASYGADPSPSSASPLYGAGPGSSSGSVPGPGAATGERPAYPAGERSSTRIGQRRSPEPDDRPASPAPSPVSPALSPVSPAASPAEAAAPTAELPQQDGPAEPGRAADGSGLGPHLGTDLPAPARRSEPDGATAGDASADDRFGTESRRRLLPAGRAAAPSAPPPAPSAPEAPAPRRPDTLAAYEAGLEAVGPEVARPMYPADRPGPRVVIENVQVNTFGIEATVEVRLVVGDRVAAGTATGPAVDGYLLRLCAMATASAVDELLTLSEHADGPVRCFVEHATAVPFGTTEVAVVVLLLSCGGWVEQLAGSAVVVSDHRHAMVRATLAAVNRRLEALLS